MKFHAYFSVALMVFAALATTTTISAAVLRPNYYDYTCPNALSTIRRVVEAAVQKERRMGASLLRLHFHDCFVNVSILTQSKAIPKYFYSLFFFFVCLLYSLVASFLNSLKNFKLRRKSKLSLRNTNNF